MIGQEISQQGLTVRFQEIADRMCSEDPQVSIEEGLFHLREQLLRARWVPRNMTPRFIALVWQLQEFVAGTLWATFGPAEGTFPKKEGLPVLHSISQNLGKFIQACLKEEPAAWNHFAQALSAFYALLRLCPTVKEETEEERTQLPYIP